MFIFKWIIKTSNRFFFKSGQTACFLTFLSKFKKYADMQLSLREEIVKLISKEDYRQCSFLKFIDIYEYTWFLQRYHPYCLTQNDMKWQQCSVSWALGTFLSNNLSYKEMRAIKTVNVSFDSKLTLSLKHEDDDI